MNVDAALVARPQSGHAQARQAQASQAQAGQAQAGLAQPAGSHPSLAQPAGPQAGLAQPAGPQAGLAQPAGPHPSLAQAGHTQAGQAQHGRLLIIGGGEDRCCSTGLLDRFVGLCGGDRAQIVLVTTATGMPDEVHAEYEEAFRKLGAGRTTELRLSGRADADGAEAAEMLTAATGVFLSGGDQSRLRTLVGSRTNDILRERLARGLVVAGTSAGATAMGRTMILGGHGPEVAVAAVRTGPGLGLVPKLLIDMHFGERGRLPRLLSAVALDPDHLGVGIDENTAILVAGTSFEVLGTGVATVADAENSTVVHPVGDCDPITLYDVRLHLLPAGCIFDIGQRTPSIGPAHDWY